MTETMTYTSLDQLPITLRADELAAVLGISRASAYTLMRSKGFPTIFIGKRMVVYRDKFIQWMDEQVYFASNANGFMLALSPAAIRQAVGMPSSTYRDQFVRLVDKGYLVQRGDSNTYDFYETPQRATHTEKDETDSGYDFTADAFGAPQTVNNDTPEDREININNINSINKCGGEKQVSPAPIKKKFEF